MPWPPAPHLVRLLIYLPLIADWCLHAQRSIDHDVVALGDTVWYCGASVRTHHNLSAPRAPVLHSPPYHIPHPPLLASYSAAVSQEGAEQFRGDTRPTGKPPYPSSCSHRARRHTPASPLQGFFPPDVRELALMLSAHCRGSS